MYVLLSKAFFPEHFRAGEPTHFKEKVISGQKKHSCRCNFHYWNDRVTKAQKDGRTLSIRQWEGKPYRSAQETILDVPASLCAVQSLLIEVTGYDPRKETPKTAIVWEGVLFTGWFGGNVMTEANLNEVARNDGLTPAEFAAFIFPVLKKQQSRALLFAVIHFTPFRY